MKPKSAELFTGYKGVRLEDLPEEAWRIVVGEGGQSEAAKLYAVVSWLYRCVDIRAGAVANMPWEIQQGDNVVMTQDDDAPDKFTWLNDLAGLLYRTEAALALTGRAYWFRERNLLRTLAVRWLRPDSVRPKIDREGLQGFTRSIGGRDLDLTVDDLVYFWLPDPFVEIGPAEHYPGRAALNAAGALRSLDAFLTGYFDRGMVKATLLTYENATVTPEERNRVREWWQRSVMGIKRSFQTEVLRGEVKPVVIGEGLKDLQNTALTAEQRESICTALGVPQSKVTANAANYATKQSDDLMFIQDTIGPECRWLAQVINRQLLGPMGLQLVFLPDSLPIMQEDEAQRAVSLKTLVEAGMSLEMATAILGYDLPDGVDLRQPAANVAPDVTEGAPDIQAGTVTEQQVLNGAQISSALSIVDTFAQGKLPRENAVFMVQTFFNIPQDVAEKLVPGEEIVVGPTATPPQLMPFTGQQQPAGGPDEAERIEETRRFLRWAKRRDNPDPEQFESVVLSREAKAALLEAASADDAPFQGDYP